MNKEDIKEVDGQKYLKVGDKWVPLYETLEEFYDKQKQVH